MIRDSPLLTFAKRRYGEISESVQKIRIYGTRNVIADILFEDDLINMEDDIESIEKKKILFDDNTDSIQDKKERLDRTTDHIRKNYLRDIIEDNQRPEENKIGTSGVLLRDEILYYQRKCNLIEPFEIENLKPAAYRLRVGDQYSVEGENKHLKQGESLEIGPFQVAIIKTQERVNLPHFLIGRWNIDVSKAYQGLLWVGGPQVDPGYSGYLFCPIYNLSSSKVELQQGESLAVIDFVKTTPFDKSGDDSFEKAWNNLENEQESTEKGDWDDPPQPKKYKDNIGTSRTPLRELCWVTLC
jgi:deoxycytidine triphosphate deaminase